MVQQMSGTDAREGFSARRAGDVVARAEQAGDWLIACDYRGWDPYDGLTSPVMRLPLMRSQSKVRFAVQQVVKRSPINLRPLLRIGHGRNPVTVALAAQAHAYLARSSAPAADVHAATAHALVADVAAMRSAGWSGNCWGYDFDWQARRVTIPAGSPTLVVTGMVTNALFEVDRLLADPLARSLVTDALPFVLHDLRRTYDPDGSFCWAYSPFDQQIVLNATMEGARLCAQVAQLTDDHEAGALAGATVAFVHHRQRLDGSWPYAEGDERSWTDNFHTGYVLECLKACLDAGIDTSQQEMLERGFRFYRENFFSAANAPLYYPGRAWPIDATACAQSLLTLCTFGAHERAQSVADWVVARMGNDDGSFAYQLGRFRLQRTPFARWSVAWMFCALARLAHETC